MTSSINFIVFHLIVLRLNLLVVYMKKPLHLGFNFWMNLLVPHLPIHLSAMEI